MQQDARRGHAVAAVALISLGPHPQILEPASGCPVLLHPDRPLRSNELRPLNLPEIFYHTALLHARLLKWKVLRLVLQWNRFSSMSVSPVAARLAQKGLIQCAFEARRAVEAFDLH